jgi:ABC-type nickel/cobalt efflux system permease component RcnA
MMNSRGKLLAFAVVLAFAAFLLWSTLKSQRVECSVTVEFQGGQNQATASAASEEDAIREAQTAACGPLAAGMDQSIACGKTPPRNRHCRTL